MNNYQEEKEIDLLRLLKALLKKWWIILICMIVGAAAGFSISTFLITPEYVSEAYMYVNNSAINVGSTKVSISSADLTAAQSLVDTYSVILKTRNTLEEVIETADLPYTYEQLYGMIEAEPVNSTEVFSIAVTSTDPVEAEQIANAIAVILPVKISDIVEGSSVKIVDYAVVPATKASPSIAKWTVMGMLIGLLISGAWIVIKELLNDEIKDERDLTERFSGMPVLASIPNLGSKSGGSGGYGYGYYSAFQEQKEDE